MSRGAGSRGQAEVTDRDSFLKGAVNAADYKHLPREERKPTPSAPKPTNLVRPGTKAYAGASINVSKKTKKKTSRKKKTPPPGIRQQTNAEIVGTAVAEPPPHIKGHTPEEIANARAILADLDEVAEQLDTTGPVHGTPVVGPEYADPAPPDAVPPDEDEHHSVAGEFQIDDIDEVTNPQTAAAPVAPVEDNPIVPPELVEHVCGLPEILREKTQIVSYLIAHGITHKIRKALDYTPEEQELYEAHTRDQKHRRASLSHFTAALRLYRNGYPINPKSALDLNAMKTGA